MYTAVWKSVLFARERERERKRIFSFFSLIFRKDSRFIEIWKTIVFGGEEREREKENIFFFSSISGRERERERVGWKRKIKTNGSILRNSFERNFLYSWRSWIRWKISKRIFFSFVNDRKISTIPKNSSLRVKETIFRLRATNFLD